MYYYIFVLGISRPEEKMEKLSCSYNTEWAKKGTTTTGNSKAAERCISDCSVASALLKFTKASSFMLKSRDVAAFVLIAYFGLLHELWKAKWANFFLVSRIKAFSSSYDFPTSELSQNGAPIHLPMAINYCSGNSISLHMRARNALVFGRSRVVLCCEKWPQRQV